MKKRESKLVNATIYIMFFFVIVAIFVWMMIWRTYQCKISPSKSQQQIIERLESIDMWLQDINYACQMK